MLWYLWAKVWEMWWNKQTWDVPTGVNKHSLVMGRAIAVYISCSLLAGSPTPWTKQKSFSSVVYVTVFCCFPFQIREQNLQDIKTAGPQSQVLSGVVVDRSLVQVREQNA